MLPARAPRALAALLTLLAAPAAAAPAIGAQDFPCVIEAQQIVKLASSALGVVAELNVDRGDIVHKGQMLGKLDDGVEAANVALAAAKATNEHDILAGQARLTFLRRKYGRAAELAPSRIVSLNTSEEAESDMKVAEQQLYIAELNHRIAVLEQRQAEEVLRQRHFESPVDGVVVERLLVPGEYRNDQSPILTLAEIDPLRVEVFVPTSFYGQVQPGATATVHPEEPLGGSYTATVTVVDHVLDAASGTFGVRLALPNPDLALPAGLKCRIHFD